MNLESENGTVLFPNKIFSNSIMKRRKFVIIRFSDYPKMGSLEEEYKRKMFVCGSFDDWEEEKEMNFSRSNKFYYYVLEVDLKLETTEIYFRFRTENGTYLVSNHYPVFGRSQSLECNRLDLFRSQSCSSLTRKGCFPSSKNSQSFSRRPSKFSKGIFDRLSELQTRPYSQYKKKFNDFRTRKKVKLSKPPKYLNGNTYSRTEKKHVMFEQQVNHGYFTDMPKSKTVVFSMVINASEKFVSRNFLESPPDLAEKKYTQIAFFKSSRIKKIEIEITNTSPPLSASGYKRSMSIPIKGGNVNLRKRSKSYHTSLHKEELGLVKSPLSKTPDYKKKDLFFPLLGSDYDTLRIEPPKFGGKMDKVISPSKKRKENKRKLKSLNSESKRLRRTPRINVELMENRVEMRGRGQSISPKNVKKTRNKKSLSPKSRNQLINPVRRMRSLSHYKRITSNEGSTSSPKNSRNRSYSSKKGNEESPRSTSERKFLKEREERRSLSPRERQGRSLSPKNIDRVREMYKDEEELMFNRRGDRKRTLSLYNREKGRRKRREKKKKVFSIGMLIKRQLNKKKKVEPSLPRLKGKKVNRGKLIKSMKTM